LPVLYSLLENDRPTRGAGARRQERAIAWDANRCPEVRRAARYPWSCSR